MTSIFVHTLKGLKTDHIPVWLMRQAGRYLPEYRSVREKAGDFLSLCYNSNLATEVTLQPLRRYDLDAAIIFSDILVVPHALGQKVWFDPGEGPRLDPITTINPLIDWHEDSFLRFLSPVFEAIDKTRSHLPKDKALIGFSGAPWTLACYMINGKGSRDFETVRLFARTNPQAFTNLIDVLVTAISSYLIRQVDAGVNALQLFDSWSGVLSTEEFQDYCINPTREIVSRVKKERPGIPVIGFPRGAGMNYYAYCENSGIDCISCDQSIPLKEMERMQNSLCVQGNLDNMLLRCGGLPMVNQTIAICDSLHKRPFIFNLGHGIMKETDPDNVSLVIKTIRTHQKGQG